MFVETKFIRNVVQAFKKKYYREGLFDFCA